MATYFSLRDGLLSDTSTYGLSLSSLEKTNNTTGYMLLTSDSWSTVLSSSSAAVIDSIAVHLSSRAASPVGVLSSQVAKYAGLLTKTGTSVSTSTPFTAGVDGSILFSGANNRLSVPYNINFVFGTGNFTIEAWIYIVTGTTSTSTRDIVSNNVTAGDRGYMFSLRPNTTLGFYTGSAWVSGPNTLPLNQWIHVAVVREGTGSNQSKLYVNGNLELTFTNSVNNDRAENLTIGSFRDSTEQFDGYISNLRIVKGTAVYTGAFTPPNTPLSPITNTTFLYKYPYLHSYIDQNYFSQTQTYPISSFTSFDGSNLLYSYPLNWQLLKLPSTFTNTTSIFGLNLKTSNPNQLSLMALSTLSGIDYDRMAITNSFSTAITDPLTGTLTKQNTVSSAIAPFSISDGSLNFNNSNSIVIVPHNDNLNLRGIPFTIECWVYPNYPNSTGRIIFSKGDVNPSDLAMITDANRKLCLAIANTVYTTNYTVPANEWIHLALVFDGSTYTAYANGSSVYTLNLSVGFSNNTQPLYIGKRPPFNDCFSGNISNFRIVRGTALYTGTFTPTAPLLTYNTVPGDILTSFLYRFAATSNYEYIDSTSIHSSNIIDGYTTQPINLTANNFKIDNIFIHKGSTLTFPNTSTTLELFGDAGLQVTSEGTLLIGTSSNPVPDNINHQISNLALGASNGGSLSIYGAYKLPSTKLVTPSVAGATSFVTTDPVSSTWKVNDTLIFTPNTAQSTSYDELVLGSFNNSNTFNTTTPASFSHSVLDYVPNIANLTRNVKIRGFSNSGKATIAARNRANVSINNTQLNFIDNNIIDGTDNTGSFTVGGCTFSGNGSETLISAPPDSFTTSFTGANSYILAPNNSLYQISLSSTFTLEVFCNFSDTGTQRRIATIYDGSGASNSVYIWALDRNNTNIINFTQYVGNTQYPLQSTTIIQSNTWYHVAVVGFGGTVYLYINGILENSTTMRNCNFSSAWRLNIARDYSLIGRLSNFRYVNGAALYTKNFFVPNTKLTSLSGTGISTLLLTCQDNPVRDNSAYNYTLTSFSLSYKFDSPTYLSYTNKNLNNNILYKTRFGIYSNNPNSDNSNFSNNLILSSRFAGIYIANLAGNAILDNNIAIGPSPYGTLLEYNTNNIPITGNTINYNNTYGTLIKNHIGVISNITNTYNTSGGVYVDASTSNLSATTLSNITASNGRTVGFLVSGNSINPLTPITLNINRLVANDNLSGGFEGYSITGNLTGLELNRNGFYGMKTSIGNGPTIIDGITALMNNVSTASAGIGILSATNYHATVIKNANVGKGVGSSTFGAGIILDSTKLSQFSVYNSTVSGGSSDFRLLTTRNILEGSYLISNTNVGVLPVGVGISRNNYQSDVFRTAGFAFTNMNNASGYNVTYLAAGSRAIDSTVNITAGTAPSERLTPQSTTIKLRSGSKFVALNSEQSTTIGVFVRKSTVASNGVAYNGSAPRLILKRNAAIGINADIVIDQLFTTSENFIKLFGTTPVVTDNGVLEFYVDCDGTQGFINIDNWTAN